IAMLLLLHLPPPRPTLFPYTTLFRSLEARGITARDVLSTASIRNAMVVHAAFGGSTNLLLHIPAIAHAAGLPRPTVEDWVAVNRSEEHTSELQSRFDLVCRLLLEKKK